MQVTLQIFIVLILETTTPTTDSILPPTSFEAEPSSFGIVIDPFIIIVLSIPWSLFSCGLLHTKLIVLQKGFCKTTTKLVMFSAQIAQNNI